MATISSVKRADNLVPAPSSSMPVSIDLNIVGTATLADNGDNIELFDLPAGCVLSIDSFGHDATLGASCTSQLRVGTTAVTAATTAGGASSVVGNGADVDVSASEQSVNILIGGADIAAAANFHLRGRIEQPISLTLET